jgi:YidC/Oxa1 family membrane protein insertase
MLILSLLATTLLPQGVAGQAVPAPAAAPQDAEFVRSFGEPGTTGSFRMLFTSKGAGVFSVRLFDHYVSRAAARKSEHATEDFQMLVSDIVPDVPSLTVREERSGLFPVRLDGSDGTAWQRQDLPDGVRFRIDNGAGLVLEKTFRHRPEQRGLALELALENRGAPENVSPVMSLTLVGPSLVNPKDATLFGNPAVAIGQAVGGAPKVLHPAQGPLRDLLRIDAQELSMAGVTNRFFGAFLFPMDETAGRAVTAVQVSTIPPVEDTRTHTPANWAARALYQLRLPVPARGGTTTATFGLYLGPKSYRVFDERPEQARFLPIMDVDLEPPCCIAVPGGRLMAELLLKLLGTFQSLVGNWGIAIMMLTILVRGALAPLNFRMQKSMRGYAQRMAVLKPKMDKIKEQHGDDPKAYQQAMLQFQREHKMLPPLGGCLPIFLTMPIYLGLFGALRVAYDLRHQPFVLWIDDLSQPDAVFDLGLPLVPYFNLLPLVWIAMFLWFQLKTPLPTDPQQRQMQMIMRFMPVLFGVLLYNYASGLMVYMVTSMVWTMFESAVTKRILGPLDPSVQAMAPTPVM